jgi:O-antigen/teichoic acid export membrane protein
MVRRFLSSPSLRAALALGCGGLAFTLCNLVFARELSADEYGVLSLFMGILSVAMLAAPIGLDLVVARRGLLLRPPLRRFAVAACLITGVLTVLVAASAYRLTPGLLISLGVSTVATGACQAAVAHFQGQRRFGLAAWLLQIPNVVLVPVALITVVAGLNTAVMLSTLIAAACVVGFAGTWYLLARDRNRQSDAPRLAMLWREALSLLAITMASAIFMQLERLVLVPTAGVQSLALFGVVAALVGSPFRMIQAAVLFTLIPALRAAQGPSERRKLLAREVVIVGATLACGSVILWLVAPPVAHGFLGGRYDLANALMLAAILSGLLKVCSAFATSVAVSLGCDRDLRYTSLSAWVSIGISCVGAFLTAPWGLTGVLYGISAGWLVRTIAAAWIAAPHLLQGRGDLPHPVR